MKGAFYSAPLALILSAVVLCIGLLVSISAAADRAKSETDGVRAPDTLPGWLGDSHLAAWSIRGGGMEDERTWVEQIAKEPRAYLYHNLLTQKECEHLIQKATPFLEKSRVVDSSTGGNTDSNVRTSSGMFFHRGEDEVIRTIEKRIEAYTHIPHTHGEGLQILRYDNGQKYDAHYDYFHDEVNTRNGGQRMATMLMYLADVEEGGETVFPAGEFDPEIKVSNEDLSECAKKGPAVRARRGDAVLFWSTHPDSSLDPKSLHGACPVIKGQKWAAVKWMRIKPYTANR